MIARTVGEVLVVTVAHGTALALAAWLLARTALRRARPGVVAALWTVVLVKFLLPFGPAMPYSLSDVIEALRTGSVHVAAPVPVPTGAAPAAIAATPVWIVVALAAWLAGIAAVGARTLRSWRRAVAAAGRLPDASAALVGEVIELARRLGAPRPASYRVGPDRDSPYVVGVIRPILVIPSHLAAPDRAAERAAVLAHELAHLRRRDPWIGVVQAVAAAVLWWCPVVAWVNRRIHAAREAACDAWAIERGPLAREQYARVLLSYVRAAAPAAGAALAARAGSIAARIDAVLDRRGRAGVGPMGVALLAVWTIIGLGGARPAAARGGASACLYSAKVATSLLAAHPEADLDGDGTLSRSEACELQAELRRRLDDAALAALGEEAGAASAEDAAVRAALAEPICCNCQGGEGISSSPPIPPVREQACVVEGDSP